MPQILEKVSAFFGNKKLHCQLHADEAIAVGAAIQGAIIGNQTGSGLDDVALIDVIPLSLGLGVKGGFMSKVIGLNSNVPCLATKNYTTTHDNQASMIIDVYEGERPMFADNYNLGKFWLEGLTLKPAGGLKITVTFDIDVSGLMHVTATETQSNITKSILIKYDNNRLQGDQILQMQQDALMY